MRRLPRIGPLPALVFLLTLLTGTVAAESPHQFRISIYPPESSADIDSRHQLAGLIEAGHFALQIRALDPNENLLESFQQSVELKNIQIRDKSNRWIDLDRTGPFTNGFIHYKRVRLKHPNTPLIRITAPVPSSHDFWELPGWYSLIPSIVAVVLALVFRQILLALLLALWSGAFLLQNAYDWKHACFALQRVFDTYLVQSVASSPDHVKVLFFSLALGGMVGILSRSGGMIGIARLLARIARGPRSAQLATCTMGSVIFFDDYANSLLVGNSMRPLTDRLGVSREKLAYLVDSTAAPIAGIALISTWIGFELGRIEDAYRIAGVPVEPYVVFLRSIPYRFYSLLALFFVFAVALLGRDFGPMLRAERRARLEGKPLRDGAQPLIDQDIAAGKAQDDIPCRAINGMLPILFLIGFTCLALFWSGVHNLGTDGELLGQVHLQANDLERLTVAHDTRHAARLVFGNTLPWKERLALLGQIISGSSAYDVLLWGAFAGSFFAGFLVWIQRILPIRELIQAWISGVKSLLLAALILVLAWAIGSICHDLSTAQWVTHVLGESLPASSLPALTFLVSAVIAFSTGSSWTTMSILFPILVPLALVTGQGADPIVLGTVGAILAGSILGDHCSPISDTTILSSMASASDHVDHVKTQLPYALTTGAVALLFGFIPTGLWGDRISPWVFLGISAGILLAILLIFGRRVEDDPSDPLDENPLPEVDSAP